MAISPQLHIDSKDFLDQKSTILTEDDVLHYRRLSVGRAVSDSSGDEDDLVLVNVFLGDNVLRNFNKKLIPDNQQTSSSQGLPARIRGTESEPWIYFPTGWSVTELQTRCQVVGKTVGITTTVNGKGVNLYHTRGGVYCSDQKCPHAGGPLHLGEIEEVPVTGQTCIVCPWHRYCFDLETGNIQRPNHRNDHLNVYPVRIESDGQISIGFKSFHESCFSDENF